MVGVGLGVFERVVQGSSLVFELVFEARSERECRPATSAAVSAAGVADQVAAAAAGAVAVEAAVVVVVAAEVELVGFAAEQPADSEAKQRVGLAADLACLERSLA